MRSGLVLACIVFVLAAPVPANAAAPTPLVLDTAASNGGGCGLTAPTHAADLTGHLQLQVAAGPVLPCLGATLGAFEDGQNAWVLVGGRHAITHTTSLTFHATIDFSTLAVATQTPILPGQTADASVTVVLAVGSTSTCRTMIWSACAATSTIAYTPGATPGILSLDASLDHVAPGTTYASVYVQGTAFSSSSLGPVGLTASAAVDAMVGITVESH